MTFKKALALLVALVLVAGLAACNGDAPPPPSDQGTQNQGGANPVTPGPGGQDGGAAGELTVLQIGVMAPLTGTNSEFGIGFEVAMQMAVDDINARGGTSNGYTFELIVRDTRGEPMESADTAREFADDPNIMAILGDFTSGSSMAAAPIVDEAGIVLLSPTASSPEFAPMSDFTFGIMGLQSGEAPWYAEFIIQRFLGKSTVGVIYVNSDWGISSFTHFEARAEAIGLDIVEAVNYVPDEMDFSALITRLRAADPEVVVILDQGAVPLIINQIRGVGWDVPLSALGPGTSAQLLEQAGENAEGLVVPSPFFFDPENPQLVEWAQRFESRAGFAPTVHPASAYDTVMLIAAAVEAIGDGEVTRQAIRDNLAVIDQEVGITGPIRFNPTGDLYREYLIAGIVNGEWVLLEGFGFADR